jgi:hypothetical protein
MQCLEPIFWDLQERLIRLPALINIAGFLIALTYFGFASGAGAIDISRTTLYVGAPAILIGAGILVTENLIYAMSAIIVFSGLTKENRHGRTDPS